MRPEASAATRRTTTRSRSPARATRSVPARDGCAGQLGRDTSPSYPWTFRRSFVATRGTRRTSGWPIGAKTRSRASPAGARGPTGYRHYSWRTRGHGSRQFIASLSCQSTGGCPQSDLAKTWVRNVRLEVADYSDPGSCGLDGTLLEAGWLRGLQGLCASGQRFRQWPRATGRERQRGAVASQDWQPAMRLRAPPVRSSRFACVA